METDDAVHYALRAIQLLLIIAAIFAGRTSAMQRANKTATLAPMCISCATVLDNGDTITAEIGTFFGLSLPHLLYMKEALILENPEILREIQATSDGKIHTWDTLFVTERTGTAILRARAKDPRNPDFFLRVDVVAPSIDGAQTALR